MKIAVGCRSTTVLIAITVTGCALPGPSDNEGPVQIDVHQPVIPSVHESASHPDL